MPRPPVIRAFFFMFPDDEDLGEIIDVIRPLKLHNVVPSLIKVTSDLYALGTEATYPFTRTGGLTPLPDEVRRKLQRHYGVGAWCVSGAFYGASDEAVRPLVERMQAHLGRSGKARYVSHEAASGNPILQLHLDPFSGRPTRTELGLLNWRPGEGAVGFTDPADDRRDCQPAPGAAGVHYVAHQLIRVEDTRPPIDEIAEEDSLAPLGMTVDPRVEPYDLGGSFGPYVPKRVQQPLEFIAAAVHVADDVEGTVLVPAVAPQRLALDGGRRHLFGRRQRVEVAEALPFQTPPRAVELLDLAVDHRCSEVAVRPGRL